MAPLSGGIAASTDNMSQSRNIPLTAKNWQRIQEANMDFAQPEQQERSRRKTRSPSPSLTSGSQDDAHVQDNLNDYVSRERHSRSPSPRKTDPPTRARDYHRDRGHRDKELLRWEKHACPKLEDVYRSWDTPADVRQRIRLYHLKQDSLAANPSYEPREPRTLMEIDVDTNYIERERAEREVKHAAMVSGRYVLVEVVEIPRFSTTPNPAESVAPAQSTSQPEDDIIMADRTEQVEPVLGDSEHDAAVQAKFNDSGIYVHDDDAATLSNTAGQVRANIDIDMTTDTEAETAALIAHAKELVQANADNVEADEGFASDEADDISEDHFIGDETQSTEDATQSSDNLDQDQPDLFAPSSSNSKGKSKKVELVPGDEGYIAPPPQEYDGMLGTFTSDMEVNLGGSSSSGQSASDATKEESSSGHSNDIDSELQSALLESLQPTNGEASAGSVESTTEAGLSTISCPAGDDIDSELQAALLENTQPTTGDTSGPSADSTAQAELSTTSSHAHNDNEDTNPPAGDTAEGSSSGFKPDPDLLKYVVCTPKQLAARYNIGNMSKAKLASIIKRLMVKYGNKLESFKVSELWFSPDRRTEMCGLVKILVVLLEPFEPNIEHEDKESMRPRLEAQENVEGKHSYRMELINLTGLAPALFIDLLLSVQIVVPQLDHELDHSFSDTDEQRMTQVQEGLRRIIDMLKCNYQKLLCEEGHDAGGKFNHTVPLERRDGMIGVDAQEMLDSEGQFQPFEHSLQDDEDFTEKLDSWKLVFPPQGWSNTAAEAVIRALLGDEEEKDDGEVTLEAKSDVLQKVLKARAGQPVLKKLAEVDKATMVDWMQQHVKSISKTMTKFGEIQAALSNTQLLRQSLQSDLFTWRQDHTDDDIRKAREEELLWYRDFAIRSLRRMRFLIREWLRVRNDKTGGVPTYFSDLLEKIDAEQVMLLTVQSAQPVTYPWLGKNESLCHKVNKEGGCSHELGLCFRSHQHEGQVCGFGAACTFGKECVRVQGPGHSVDTAPGSIQVKPAQVTANDRQFCMLVNREGGCAKQKLGTCPYQHHNEGQTCTHWLKNICSRAPGKCAFLHGQPTHAASQQRAILPSSTVEDLTLRVSEVLPENKWLKACAFVNAQGCRNPLCSFNHTLKGVICPKSDGRGSCLWIEEGLRCPFEHVDERRRIALQERALDDIIASGQITETSKPDSFGAVNKRMRLADAPPLGAPTGPRRASGQSPRPSPLLPMSGLYGQQQQKLLSPYGGSSGASIPMGWAIQPPRSSTQGQPLLSQPQPKAPTNAPTGPKSMAQSRPSPHGPANLQQRPSVPAVSTRQTSSGNGAFGALIQQNLRQQGPSAPPTNTRQPTAEYRSFGDLIQQNRMQRAAGSQSGGAQKRKYSDDESSHSDNEARTKRKKHNGRPNNARARRGGYGPGRGRT